MSSGADFAAAPAAGRDFAFASLLAAFFAAADGLRALLAAARFGFGFALFFSPTCFIAETSTRKNESNGCDGILP
jgi:hypothetical protein